VNMPIKKFDPLVQFITATAIGRSIGKRAALVCGERYGWDVNCVATRALLASVDGGGLIPLDLYGKEIIDALRPRTVVRKHVPADNIVTMRHGNMQIGRANTSATVTWIGEDAATEISTQPDFGDVSLQVKKATVRVPVSNSLLRDGGDAPGVERVVEQQLLGAFGAKEDGGFLTGIGSQWVPKGLRHSAATVNTATQSYSVTTVLSDLTGLINALEIANVKMIAPCWFTSPQVIDYLRTAVATGSGNLMFNDVRDGRLLGWPIEQTTSIPANLGGSSNQSEIYLVDMDSVIIGQGFVEIGVHPSGTYTDGNGNLKSAFERDESILRLTAGVDIGLKHNGACAVLTNVPWAA
jgi:HK97 family phage major capsid protein